MTKRTKIIILVVSVTILWSLAVMISPYCPIGPTKCHDGFVYFSRFNSNPTPVYNQDGTLKTCEE